MRKFLITALLLSALPVHAQPYAVDKIPEPLRKGSNAVIRESSTDYIYHNPGSGTQKRTEVITVLNKDGNEDAAFYLHTDKFSSLKNFSGEIYDRNGKAVRKIKRSDIETTDYSSELASDITRYFYEPHLPYPYTVKYVYEITHKNGILSLPNLTPQSGYDVAVEKAVYRFTAPAGVEFNTKYVNTAIQPEISTSGNNKTYTWELVNLPSIGSEIFNPPYFDLFPAVYFSPHAFKYDNYSGSMESWEAMGRWQWGLLEGRTEIPAELKSKIAELTATAGNDREKVKILYDYLGETTRYVSIQLGIGGWQPMKASEVYKTKFGDCKALSNYMLALLRECGIEARYTEIGTHTRRLFRDMPNQFQTNHVILQVPLPGDTIWLECTNPEIPFGYIHPNIAGHDALVYYDGTSHIETLPAYADTLNADRQSVRMKLLGDRSAEGNCIRRFEVNRYSGMRYFKHFDAAKQTNEVRKMVNIPVAKVSGITFNEDKSPLPSIGISYDVSAMQYGTQAGDRILLPLNPFRDYSSYGKTRQERKTDIYIPNGFLNADELTLEIPADMEIEGIPKPVLVTNRFGTYTSLVIPEEHSVRIIQKLHVKSGDYPAESYDELRELFTAAANGNKTNIILKKSNP